MPDPEHLPTGRELVEEYLEPLAALPEIRPHVRLGTRVVGVSRRGFDKLRTQGRETAPFVLRVLTPAGEEEILARAVIDASGTYESPNPLGADGTSARGEARIRDRVFYGIPDVLGAQRQSLRRPARGGRRQRPLGAEHAARPRRAGGDCSPGPRSRGSCGARRRRGSSAAGAADALPARGALGQQARALLERGRRHARRRPDRRRLPDRRRRCDPGRGRPHPGRGRRAGGGHRLPPGPRPAPRAAARPRPDHGGPAGARPADRPERPQLRHGAAARRGRAARSPSRASTSSA